MAMGKQVKGAIHAGQQAPAMVQCATFEVEQLFCGIDVQHVQEVLNAQETTRIPRAPAIVEGLINLRGQIVTAIDMRKRMGLPARQNERRPMNMVIRTSDGPLSLLVDEIGEVIEVHREQYEETPASLELSQRELLQGVYKLDGRLMLMLEPERVAAIAITSGPAVVAG
jgi:purine-binding chemotaxis protein CheW